MASRGLALSFDILFGDFAASMDAHEGQMAEAATNAMDTAVNVAKAEGRADIARAGFSRRWQNALRGERKPDKPRRSINPTGIIRHAIPYAGVFEEGATIHGSPLLWLPFSTTAKKVGGQKMTAARFPAPLVSMESRNGLPMLGAAVRLSGAKASQPSPTVSLATVRKGVASTGPSGRKRRGVVRLIPMFFGVSSVDIPKKMNITAIVAKASDKIPGYYARELALAFGSDN